MAENTTSTTQNDDRHQAWQLRLMPFMIGLILTLALFFFAATMYQLYQLNIKIQDTPKLQNLELLEQPTTDTTLLDRQWRSLVLLESHVLQQRYHHANVLLMARV